MHMSPKRRPKTTRVVAYLDASANTALTSLIESNYSATDSYGAVSHIVSDAVNFYYDHKKWTDIRGDNSDGEGEDDEEIDTSES